jgi:hypothetical protein
MEDDPGFEKRIELLMEQCPNCRKTAVEKDQCLSCGIVVSRWLRLHSVIPPETSNQSEEDLKAIYHHVPPGITMKKDIPPESVGSERDISRKENIPAEKSKDLLSLEPPDFITDADATVPISETPKLKPLKDIEQPSSQPLKDGRSPAAQAPGRKDISDKRTSFSPAGTGPDLPKPASPDEKKKKQEQPSFFAKTEADMIKLKRDLKTDWEDYYATRKGRYLSGKSGENIATRFRIRNMFISLLLLAVSFFAADIGFLMQFGITAEYSSLHPLTTIAAIISFFISLSALLTLKPSSVKITPGEEGKVKIGMHPLQLIEISLLLLLIILLPLKPSFDVSGKSEFPILSENEMTTEFLTGEGLGNFIRPVLGRDGKTVYAIHLYGQSTGYLVMLPGDGSYKPVFRGSKITKFRFLSKDTILYLDSEGLHKISLEEAGQNAEIGAEAEIAEDAGPAGERVLAGYTPSDFDLSADSSMILFCSAGDIWLSKSAFTNAENITNTPSYLDFMPSFFPDGSGFLYAGDILPITGDVSYGADTEEWYDEMAVKNAALQAKCYQVFSYIFAEATPVKITDDDNNYYYPLYSPDMKKIAVVVEAKSNITVRAGPLNLAERALVLMNPDASGKVRIFPPLNMPLRAMHEMSWYPDSKELLVGINALLQKGIYHLTF